MAPEPPVPTRLAPQMTDAEALMWHVERDPWFASTIGTIVICEGSIDAARFRRRIEGAVAALPRLRERVVPRPGRFGTPLWRTDPEFELGYHLRNVSLPAPGARAQLLELATRLLQDPFDRTRPLWQFWVVDGLVGPDGSPRSAVVIKLHHTVTDGQGGVKLAERYMDLGPDDPRGADVDPHVDLDEVIRRAVAAEAAEERSGAGPGGRGPLGLGPLGLGGSALSGVGHRARRQLDLVRRLAAESALTMADPGRVPERLERTGDDLRALLGQLGTGESSARSPLWRARSRQRHLEVLSLPFRPAKAAAGALGGSLNDFFVTGAVSGAARYHQAHETPVEHLTITFVVSTRTGRSEGGNAFTPSKAVVPAGTMAPTDRFDAVRAVLGSRRAEVSGDGMLSGLAGLANLLPASVTTRLARAQAGAIDFATSNVRAAPFEVYVAGARVVATYPVGPVAGTAWNLTLMSYAGQLHLGVNLDPVAVPDAERLVSSLAAGYGELFAAGGVPTEVTLDER